MIAPRPVTTTFLISFCDAMLGDSLTEKASSSGGGCLIMPSPGHDKIYGAHYQPASILHTHAVNYWVTYWKPRSKSISESKQTSRVSHRIFLVAFGSAGPILNDPDRLDFVNLGQLSPHFNVPRACLTHVNIQGCLRDCITIDRKEAWSICEARSF